MDGVAGIDPKHPAKSKNYIYVVGAGELSQEFIEINARAKESTGSTIELTSAPYFNSDQYNFQTQFIPFIYYSTGLTEHYHQPSDEPATIDFDHFARVVQLIFASTWEIANQDARPKAVDRSRLALDGYVCPPCPFECDDAIHARGGECAVCGMGLIPRYSISKTAD
jgi:hypothetical protein